jgi:hypothetical protein
MVVSLIEKCAGARRLGLQVLVNFFGSFLVLEPSAALGCAQLTLRCTNGNL